MRDAGHLRAGGASPVAQAALSVRLPPPSRPRYVTEKRRDNAGVSTRTVSRRDLGYLRPSQRTPQGFMLCEGVAAIAGIYDYVYKQADGTHKVVRELVDADVLRSYAGQLARTPLTLEHPSEDVTPHNVTKYGVGDVDGEVDFVKTDKGGFVRVRMCVRADNALSAIEGGKDQLSCGYDVVVDTQGGTHPVFGDYDQRQVERKDGNHLAIVGRARHGASAKMRHDADTLGKVLDGVPDGTGVHLSPLPRLDHAEETSTTPHEDHMDPNLIALAAIFGVTRADGQSDADFSRSILAAGQRKADAAACAAALTTENTQLKADAAALVTQATTLDGKLKDSEGHTDGMSPSDLTKLAAVRIDTLAGERDALKQRADTAEAALKKHSDAEAKTKLDALVAAKGITVEVKDGDDVAAYSRKVADALMGGKLPEDASAPYIAAVIDSHSISLPAPKKDGRYDGFRGGKGGEGGGRRDADDPRRDSHYDPSMQQHDSAFYGDDNKGSQQ